MLLLELFWSFMKIGLTSFGGLSMVPLINEEMIAHGWMNAAEVSDIVAIAEMTPGPLGLNCATFAGMRTAGIWGAIFANLGVLMPTLTICLVAAIFFKKFKDSRRMQQIMVGVRPVCIGMIVGVMISLAMSNYIYKDAVSPAVIAIGLVGAVGLYKKLSIPVVLVISAVLGMILIR